MMPDTKDSREKKGTGKETQGREREIEEELKARGSDESGESAEEPDHDREPDVED